MGRHGVLSASHVAKVWCCLLVCLVICNAVPKAPIRDPRRPDASPTPHRLDANRHPRGPPPVIRQAPRFTVPPPVSGPPASQAPDPEASARRQKAFDIKASALDNPEPTEWGLGARDFGGWNYIRARQEFSTLDGCRLDTVIVSSEPRFTGLITTLRGLGHCMMYTLARQMTFVVDESYGRIGNSKGVTMGDFFMPISTCWRNSSWKLPTTRLIRQYVGQPGMNIPPEQCFSSGEERRALFANSPPRIVSSDPEFQKLHNYVKIVWWGGMYMHWMLRPNSYMQNWLQEYCQKIKYPSPRAREAAVANGHSRPAVVAVHIRGGDKARERGWDKHLRNFGGRKYFEAVFRLRKLTVEANKRVGIERWRVPTVLFLATDEKDIAATATTVLAEVAKQCGDTDMVARGEAQPLTLYVRSCGPQLLYVYLQVFSEVLMLFVCVYCTRRAVDHEVMREFSMVGYLVRNPSKGHTSAKEVLTDLMLIASADYIVATASSTVSTVASHMFAARQVS
eukprot:COSAG01_NODE_11808_length_1854_cov_10.544729_1_plen_507_part_10